MTKIYLMRHGETIYNLQGRLTGRGSDPELTEKGKLQADKIGQVLKETGISHIVSSNMTRTNQTAEIISKHLKLEIHIDSELQEKDKGGLEGELISVGLPIINALSDNEVHPIYGGESDAVFRGRVVQAICKYFFHEKNEVLLVSHGFVGSVAAKFFLEKEEYFHNSHYIILEPEKISDLVGKCFFGSE
jgi:broad specificity phosphatase PhoE